MMTNKLVTAAEVAESFNVSVRSVYDAARKGVLPCYRLQRQVRFNLQEVFTACRASRIIQLTPGLEKHTKS